MAAVLPDFGGYRRIVQAPGTVSIFYDTGQGQGWQRIIPLDAGPHLPRRSASGSATRAATGKATRSSSTSRTSHRRATSGRAREPASRRALDAHRRENARVHRDDRGSDDVDETVDRQAGMTRQDEQANRIYYEPRCHEGNYGLPALLSGTRAEEAAFAEGNGPDPATKDSATDFGTEGGVDALTGGG